MMETKVSIEYPRVSSADRNRWARILEKIGVNRPTPFQLAVHIGAWLPAIWLVVASLSAQLTVNPYQALEQRTGKIALVLLVLSLACTPIYIVFGFRQSLKVRRLLGLYTFLYALAHFLIFSGLDYRFNLAFIWADSASKPYIYVGLAALLILTSLAVTSYRWAMKALGKNWKRLHRLVYLVGILVIFHYAWVKKGDLFALKGDILQPFAFGLLVLFLLLVRIPPISKWIILERERIIRAWVKS